MKNTFLSHQILFLVLVIALLSGCTKMSAASEGNANENSGCLAPVETLAFSVGEYSPTVVYEENPPPSGWQNEATLPDSYFPGSMVYFDGYLWIGAIVSLKPETAAVWRYEISTRKWKMYSAISGFARVPSFDFFVSSDNTLWGVTGKRKHFDESSKLIKYNPNTDMFEYVDDSQHLLSKTLTEVTINDIDVDQNGHIWLADAHGVYEFIPETSEITARVLAVGQERFLHLQVDTSGNVWFLDNEGRGVKKYNPVTSELEGSYINSWFEDDYNYGHTTAQDGFYVNRMLLDKDGRLWLDDKGWFDVNAKDINGGPLWYRVIRSPLFIAKTSLPLSTGYLWEKPRDMYQSSDGLMWFGSSRGVVRLNPYTEEWCLLALSFPIAEDDQHNLWAYYENTLYKYSLEK